jgi:hypothetical protein
MKNTQADWNEGRDNGFNGTRTACELGLGFDDTNLYFARLVSFVYIALVRTIRRLGV